MLENFDDSSKKFMEDVRNAIDAERSAWKVDNEVEKILRKKRQKLKRLKRKLKRGCGSKKKQKKKIKMLKKRLKVLQKEKKQQEDRLKYELQRAECYNNMLKMFCLLQMNGGKEYFMKQIFQSDSKGLREVCDNG